MRDRSWIFYQFVLLGLVISLQPWTSQGSVKTFRERYSRTPSVRLSAIPEKQFHDSTVESCAEKCVKETEFLCKSFDIDNSRKTCVLYRVDEEDRDVTLIDAPQRDHYSGAFARLFDVTPGHRLHAWLYSALGEVSVEQCARSCILETRFKCLAFNYNKRDRNCKLTQHTAVDSHGVIDSPLEDYYRRKPESDLAHFINFGQTALKQLTQVQVYQHSVTDISLDECAKQCLEQEHFHCSSFDFVHDGEVTRCDLSQFIAANAYGLREVEHRRVNHYERVERDLSYFYPTPYSILLGNDLKTYKFVNPNRCAQKCITEEAFICRSFDYQITEGTCTLSDKTGSDVGGLYYDGIEEVHHFEMKPLFVCGGNLTDPKGNFASPNWPRNYTHHESCVWNITVGLSKVITLHFLTVDFGQQKDYCGENSDRLVIEEEGSTQCVSSDTQSITTKTNSVFVSFFSNSEIDAQGFRVFYEADWTCDSHMSKSPGDLASPHWPENYPPATQCSWRITAPLGQRIRLYFTSFQLEEHELGHCREDLDNVKILDGGTSNSPTIALYCGKRSPFSIKSSGTDMFITFHSDISEVNEGFHATFVFEDVDDSIVVSDPKVPALPVDLDKEIVVTPTSVSKSKHMRDNSMSSEEESSEEDNDVDVKLDQYSSQGSKEEVAAVLGSSKDREVSHGEYKTAMWSIFTLMLIIIIALSVILFLVWRHFERKLRHFGEIIRDDHLLGPEEIPLEMTTLPSNRPNNEVPLLGNEVDVFHSGSAAGACAGATASDNMSNYGKYTKDNIKNVNLDTKYSIADDYKSGKNNLTGHKNLA